MVYLLQMDIVEEASRIKQSLSKQATFIQKGNK